MEDELIVQQNEYERRSPNENTLLWFDRYSEVYESLAEKTSPYEAFSKLVLIKNEIEGQLERAKNSLDKFSEELKAKLINEEDLENGSHLEQLHHNIKLSCLLTFNSSTFGNFMHGGMNMQLSEKEIRRIKKKFPDELETFQSLQEIVREYLRLTNQKKIAGITHRIPKAFELRFLADKLTYQKTALDIHIQRLLLFDFPLKIPVLKTTERERLNKFLSEKENQRRSTPSELYMDIYFLIKRLQQIEHDRYLFKNDKLVYRVAAQTALDDDEDNTERAFALKWKKTKNNPDGVTSEWLEKKIKEIYEEVIQA